MKELPQLETVLKAQKVAADKIRRATKIDCSIRDIPVDDQLTVVYGLRGVGKTWWAIGYCQSLGVSTVYIDAEDDRLKQIKGLTADEILETVVKLYGDCHTVIIDEFLKLDIWNEIVDTFIRSGWRVIALNSGEKPEIVPCEVMMHPLSWPQYCRWHEVTEDMSTPIGRGLMRKAFDDYLLRGGLPAMQSRRQFKAAAEAIISETIAHDAANGVRPSVARQLHQLTVNILHQSPVVLNYKELLPDTDVKSVNTLRKYVDEIKTTAVIRPLVRLSMFDNVRNFMEKLYAADMGLMGDASRLARIETAVYIHLDRYCRHMGYMMHYYGNRDRQCHFAVCRDMRMRVAVEYVSSADDDDVMQSVLSGFMSLSRTTGCNKLILLTENNQGLKHINGAEVEMMPVYVFLSKISQPVEL